MLSAPRDRVISKMSYSISSLPNDGSFPSAITKRLAAVTAHKDAHASFCGETKYAKINSRLTRHAVRKASTKAAGISMHFMSSAF
jgi:hypothetical protein